MKIHFCELELNLMQSDIFRYYGALIYASKIVTSNIRIDHDLKDIQ